MPSTHTNTYGVSVGPRVLHSIELSLGKYLQCTYYVPGPVLGTRCTEVNQTAIDTVLWSLQMTQHRLQDMSPCLEDPESVTL